MAINTDPVAFNSHPVAFNSHSVAFNSDPVALDCDTRRGRTRGKALRLTTPWPAAARSRRTNTTSSWPATVSVKFGTRNVKLGPDFIPRAQGKEPLFLTEIREFQRHYEWVAWGSPVRVRKACREAGRFVLGPNANVTRDHI
ncbi:MAG TPA: hypothetical protein VEO54_04625 [Thermoanaerobaculia bacterium]|nr:hypothetical protein [Thermoanaerobaculia bacterium]